MFGIIYHECSVVGKIYCHYYCIAIGLLLAGCSTPSSWPLGFFCEGSCSLQRRLSGPGRQHLLAIGDRQQETYSNP